MRTRGALLLLAALALGGCTSWEPGTLGSGPVPSDMQVTLASGRTVEIKQARLVGDSLLVGRDFYGDNISVPLRDVGPVQTRHLDPGRTLALVGVSVGVGLPVLYTALGFLVSLCIGPCT